MGKTKLWLDPWEGETAGKNDEEQPVTIPTATQGRRPL